jgi:hypothetical protein
MTARQEPIRLDHITTQYIWALENEHEFVMKARHEAKRGNFGQFTVLVEQFVKKIKRIANTPDIFHAEEWAFLFLEMWWRMDGQGPDSTWAKDDCILFQVRIQRLNVVGYNYTPNGVQRRPPATNPCAEIALGQHLQEVKELCEAVDTLTSQPLSQPIQEQPVSNQITIANKTYINNVDVTTMSDDQLIDAIKKVEKEIEDLGSVKTKSKKIEAKVSEANETLNKLVTLLDAR